MMQRPIVTAARMGALSIALVVAECAIAQSFNRAGGEFNAMRSVTVPTGKPYTIVVTEFFHHGQIRPDGRNVVVTAQNRLVPMRILQLGSDDVCRLAFQTVAGQSEYDIYYGGDPPTESIPPWTCRDGLLLETRQFTACNLNSLDAVRGTFDKATPIGADYVEGVFHSYNPFTLKSQAFLSRYSGSMDIRKPGVYGFMLSSQDCSFLLIDDKLVAAAPGRHGPAHQAIRGSRSDVRLSAGEHKFEYYHAAAGTSAVMVLAWEIDPVGDKPERPQAIPPEVFHTHLVAHLPATRLSLRTTKQAPDFVVKITSDVPLPDNDVPLVGVLFRDNSVKALTMQGAKLQWDFGDGQTSDLPNVDHVYLRPGLYPVKFSVRRGGKTIETINRIYVDRPHLSPKDRLYAFDDYLKIIDAYDPKKLDAKSLRQMVLTLEAKALTLANQAEDAAHRAKATEEDPNRRPATRKEAALAKRSPRDDSPPESVLWLAKAVEAGKVAFVEQSAATGDEELLKLVQLIGPMARERLGDSETAFQIWRGASERIAAAESKAECEIAAADIALNDLLDTAQAKSLLDAATKRLGANRLGPITARLERVWGDYYAATGDGKAARKSYGDAVHRGGFAKSFVESTAIRGAHARSAEEFIKLKEFGRAAEELHAWQREFPTEKIDGYLTLQFARYWAARGKYAQAIAQAEQLLAVNRDSPYVDQLLMVAADSEMRRGRKDRALATLHSLVKDYPGSPLAPLAKKNIEVLERGGK